MMKLSMGFICSQLPYKTEVINEKQGIKYSGISIGSPSSCFKEDTIYLFLSGEMQQAAGGTVWIGKEEPETDMPVIWVRETVDPIQVFDDIFDVFHRFRHWAEEVAGKVSARKPLKEILQLLNQVTINPWYLTDNGFRTCVMKEDPVAMDISALWRYQYFHGHMAFQAIYKLISSGDMTIMNRTEQAIIFHKTEAFHMPFVSRTIFSPRGITGHLFIIGMHNELSCYETELADYFCEMISPVMDYVDESSMAARSVYDFFFIDLIEGNEVKEAERKTLMNTIKWKEQDEYIACVMTIPSFWQVQNKLNTITVYEIEEMMPCKAFLYDDQVVFLLNKTHLISQMGKEYTPVRYLEEKLQMIAKNCGGSIGYSDSFREMGKLSIYYRQAVLAAAYASSSGRGILPYHHVSVPHLLREAEQAVSRDLFLHPAVRVLEEYDSANHTEFLKTLYIYLKNERRTTETVKELYIHRNSLLYRLERIREITGFQLEDYRERLRMLLSCEIYFGQQYL